jgi:hypothetical protein
LLDAFGDSVKTVSAVAVNAIEQVWNEVLERFDKQQMATHLKKSRQDAQAWMQSRRKKIDP